MKYSIVEKAIKSLNFSTFGGFLLFLSVIDFFLEKKKINTHDEIDDDDGDDVKTDDVKADENVVETFLTVEDLDLVITLLGRKQDR